MAAHPDPWARALSYVVAVDGGEPSKRSFETVLSLYKKGDKVTVLHIADPTKDYLAFEHKPSSVREYYENQCLGLPKEAASVRISNKPAGTPTRDAILAAVNKMPDADFLVVGFVGRKGPKDDPQVMGKTADVSMRAAHMTAIITKAAAPPTGAGVVLAVAVDGSERAHEGVQLALRLAKPADRVALIHVEDLSAQPATTEVAGTAKGRKYDSDEVEIRYTAFCKTAPQASFQRVVRGREDTVAACICAAADAAGASFLVVGVDGLNSWASGKRDHVGSNSDGVVRMASCTVIAVQRRHGTYDHKA